MESATMSEPLQTPAERPYHALSAIPDIDRKILDGVAKGMSLQAIATLYGVSDVAILNRATQYPEYRLSLKIGSQLRMEQREAQLEAATDNVSVTRADRLLGHARWIAERACPEAWGQKQQVQVDAAISISIVKSGRIIEATDNQSAALPAPILDESGS